MISGLASSADSPSRDTSSMSLQSRNILLQSWGIRDGYSMAVDRSVSFLQLDAPSLSMVDIFILNSDGVIDELLTAYGGQEQETEDILVQRTALLKKGSRRKNHRKKPKS